jgi:hypothetical protein
MEKKINAILENQQELQTTLIINRQRDENQREQNQDREMEVIRETHEKQSKSQREILDTLIEFKFDFQNRLENTKSQIEEEPVNMKRRIQSYTH